MEVSPFLTIEEALRCPGILAGDWTAGRSLDPRVSREFKVYPPSQKTTVVKPWMNAVFCFGRISLPKRRRYHGCKPVELHCDLTLEQALLLSQEGKSVSLEDILLQILPR